MASRRCQKFREWTSIRRPEMSLHQDATTDLMASPRACIVGENLNRSHLRRRGNTDWPKNPRNTWEKAATISCDTFNSIQLSSTHKCTWRASRRNPTTQLALSYSDFGNYDAKFARLRHISYKFSHEFC